MFSQFFQRNFLNCFVKEFPDGFFGKLSAITAFFFCFDLDEKKWWLKNITICEKVLDYRYAEQDIC